ncbi:MAG: ADP-ribosylglycohydrolase family protein [Clostridiales bacterium]|nr:ADP-ribosylglycohydrolase family protein [Clostridiales bacterium]
MIGAIIGDIVGSRFEFDAGEKSREFELFAKGCSFTDDTVMTIAVAEALMNAGKEADEKTVKAELIRSMKKWGQAYPNAGYGARFIHWVLSDDPKPYGSYGNGSGMRVSPAGWLYDTIERTREVARWTAEVTHNHPEGVKGAESVAAAIFMARNGASKEEIKQYIVDEFGYDLTRTLDEIRPSYHHVEDCMRTMPEAFTCFLEAESYEETLRNVMYIGGDTDTLAAIAGAVAEAMWGIPVRIIIDAQEFIPDDIDSVVQRFNGIVHSTGDKTENPYNNNQFIKTAIDRVNETRRGEDMIMVLDVLMKRMDENGEAPTPMVDVNNVITGLDPDKLVMGKDFTIGEEVRLRKDTVTDGEGREWFPLFTDDEELDKKPMSPIRMNVPIRIILEDGLNSDRVEGVVINPFGQPLQIPKDILKIMFEVYNKKKVRGDEPRG